MPKLKKILKRLNDDVERLALTKALLDGYILNKSSVNQTYPNLSQLDTVDATFDKMYNLYNAMREKIGD